MESGEKVILNFGKRFSVFNSAMKYWSIDECESLSKGIHKFTKETLFDAFRKLLSNLQVNIEEADRCILTCILWEYILPSLNYDYIIEETFIPFLDSLNEINQFDAVIKSLINYCLPDELNLLFSHLFHLLAENSLNYCYINDAMHKNTILPLVLRLINYQPLLGAWLQSNTFFEDLECLYFTHLPSKSDLEREIPNIYYPDKVFHVSNKSTFYKQMEHFCAICNTNEDYLLILTKIFLGDSTIYCSNGNKLIPRSRMIGFLDYLIKKNIKYTQEFPGNRCELTRPSAITNIVFSLFNYLELPILNAHPKHFPFSTLYRAEDSAELSKLDRMGGLLSHLTTMYYKENIFQSSTIINAIDIGTAFNFSLFNRAVILFNYAVNTEFQAITRGNEICLYLRYKQEERLEDQKEDIEPEIKDAFMREIPYQQYILTPVNIKVL